MPATSSNCCKSAKPQMLSVTQKSTLSQQQQQQPRQNHQTNPPQSVPFLSLPILFPSWRCTHSLPSTKLFNLLAIYYGSSLWDYRAARRQLHRGRTRRADCRLWAIANKKGGKSTLLWHLILILLPYLSIDSGDCRCGGIQIHFVH